MSTNLKLNLVHWLWSVVHNYHAKYVTSVKCLVSHSYSSIYQQQSNAE